MCVKDTDNVQRYIQGDSVSDSVSCFFYVGILSAKLYEISNTTKSENAIVSFENFSLWFTVKNRTFNVGILFYYCIVITHLT